jgi:beta-galactosidase
LPIKSKIRFARIALAVLLTGGSCGALAASAANERDRSFAATKLTAKFDVPYQPGELRAVGLINGKEVAKITLKTAGEAKELRLTAGRSKIRADRNDLSYVTVDVVDQHGAVVPNATIPVCFTVTGAGELAATGSSAPNEASSFHLSVRKTCQGRCLAILRPAGSAGKITLKAEADGLKAATITVQIK